MTSLEQPSSQPPTAAPAVPVAVGAGGSPRLPAMLELTGMAMRLFEWAVVVVTGLTLTAFLSASHTLGPLDQYVRGSLLGGVVFLLLAEVTGSYDLDARFSMRVGATRMLGAWIGAAVAMLTLAFFLKTSDTFSRSWSVLWFATTAGGLIVARGATTLGIRALKRRGAFNQRVAILGPGQHRDRLAAYILGNPKLTVDLVGYFDTEGLNAITTRVAGLPYLGNVDRLEAEIRHGHIDQVIIALPLVDENQLDLVVSRLAMLPVLIRLAPDLSTFAFAARSLVVLGELPLVTVFERPINGVDQLIKKIEDILLGGLISLALLPIFAAIAAAIKLDSPGPVFFRQEREGFNHRKFLIWKFRSMRADAAQLDNIQQASARDPRVTRVGRILRRTSLDELPQLLNVLRGEMSLVGPRPHAASTKVGQRRFSEAAQGYAARHRVKPGMTGWAQVNGWRGETDTDDKLTKRIEYDLFYIEHWSIAFDFYILLRTGVAILKSKSAY